MVCSKCGFENDIESTYCSRCGKKIQSKTYSGRKFPAFVVTVGIVLVAFVVILLVSDGLFRKVPSKKHTEPGYSLPITVEPVPTTPTEVAPVVATEPSVEIISEPSSELPNKLKYPISEEDCYIIYRNYFGYDMKSGENSEVVVDRYGEGNRETLSFAIYRLNSNTGGYTLQGIFFVGVNTGICERDGIKFQADDYYYSSESPTEPQTLSSDPKPMIDAGNYHSVYLRKDGTVAAVGSSQKSKYANRGLRCDVSGWTDIVEISAASHTVGLRADGTVVATGVNRYGQCNIGNWKDIVSVSAGDNHTMGLRSNGTVVAVGYSDLGQCDVSAWKDIVQISAGAETSYGLRANGTVVAVGGNRSGQREVSAWSNITAISAGIYYVVGLKSDGTVITSGISEEWEAEYSTWTNIVAISAGSTHMVGLRSDGSVVACGRNDKGQCDVSHWTDISSVSVGMYFTIGLMSDGTLVAVGDNSFGQLDIVKYV